MDSSKVNPNDEFSNVGDQPDKKADASKKKSKRGNTAQFRTKRLPSQENNSEGKEDVDYNKKDDTKGILSLFENIF